MTYVKHNDKRVNLANIVEYRPHGDTYLVFTYAASKDDGRRQLVQFEFPNKDARDKSLNEIDKLMEVNEIGVKESSTSGHAEVNMQVIE